MAYKMLSEAPSEQEVHTAAEKLLNKSKPDSPKVKQDDETMGDMAKRYAAGMGSGYVGGKVLSKLTGKAIPGVSLGFYGADAYKNIKQGDYTGAALNAASAAASFIPWVGIPIALGIDYYNDKRHEEPDSLTVDVIDSIKQNLPQLKAGADEEIAVLQYQIQQLGEPVDVDGFISPELVDSVKKYQLQTESTNHGNRYSMLKFLKEDEATDMYVDINNFVSSLLSAKKYDETALADYITNKYPSVSDDLKNNVIEYGKAQAASLQELIKLNQSALKKVTDWAKQHLTGGKANSNQPASSQPAPEQPAAAPKASTAPPAPAAQQSPVIKHKLSQMEEMELHSLAFDLEKVQDQDPSILPVLELYYQLYGKD